MSLLAFCDADPPGAPIELHIVLAHEGKAQHPSIGLEAERLHAQDAQIAAQKHPQVLCIESEVPATCAEHQARELLITPDRVEAVDRGRRADHPRQASHI
eukprot:CAMPEP_0183439242 /NCGR_PEP_ID=MMETSP0370-20130417/77893_1 /TAXON_ID=268820 /ORGANISM="Peridinium aciculiferum, Strain PAER-2" /LENGTH=99 /DNA_ID=CAMNT_0025627655 /DNA_START=125 /DNA_END=421 /DNA_ORIENTATION=-